MRSLVSLTEHEIGATVATLKASGLSFAQIGKRLGISKQKAHRLMHKYGGGKQPTMHVIDEIGTPAEVLQRHNLNPAEWRAVRFSEWEAQAKHGKIKTLTSTRFERIDPAAEAMQQIAWQVRPRKPFTTLPAQQHALVVPDSQIGYSRSLSEQLTPYHDRQALDVCLQAAKLLGDKLAFIYFCGDMLDCAESTRKFSKPASTQRTMWPAMLEWRWLLEQFRIAAPHAVLCWAEGNHEGRIRRTLVDSVPELADLPPADDPDGSPLLSMQRMMGLDSIDVQYLGPYGSKAGELHRWGIRFHHGDKVGKAGATAGKYLNERTSQIYGHVHRMEQAWSTKPGADGQPVDIFSATFGCTCHTDGRVPSNKPHHNWQQGMGILTRCSDGWVEPTPVRIRAGGRATVLGTELCGSDYVERLRAETNYPY